MGQPGLVNGRVGQPVRRKGVGQPGLVNGRVGQSVTRGRGWGSQD